MDFSLVFEESLSEMQTFSGLGPRLEVGQESL